MNEACKSALQEFNTQETSRGNGLGRTALAVTRGEQMDRGGEAVQGIVDLGGLVQYAEVVAEGLLQLGQLSFAVRDGLQRSADLFEVVSQQSDALECLFDVSQVVALSGLDLSQHVEQPVVALGVEGFVSLIENIQRRGPRRRFLFLAVVESLEEALHALGPDGDLTIERRGHDVQRVVVRRLNHA